MKPLPRIASWAAALVVLGTVFAAWMSPHLVVDLAAYLAACF